MQPQQPYQGPPPAPGQTPYGPLQQPSQPAAPNSGGYPAQDPAQPVQYDFIMNPGQPVRQNPLGASSMKQRILLIAGGLVILLLLFSVVSKLLAPADTTVTTLTGILQEQQELIHLTTTAQIPTGLSASNQAFVTTANLSTLSAQKQLMRYLASNKKKIVPKTLLLREDPAIDAQLAAAATSGSYNAAFQDALHAQLTTYQALLQKAYLQVKGTKGHALIKTDYDAAKLLEQLLTRSNS